MTDLPMNTGHENLGVGKIVGDTFSLFFNRITSVFTLAFPPALLVVLISYWAAPSFGEAGIDPSGYSPGGQLAVILIGMVIMSFVTALLVRLAYDAKVGNPIRPAAYLSSAVAVIVPLVICSLIVTIATSFALIAFIVPGLWVYAVWCCVTPAIVIENAGFGSFGRSAQLTKEYRWPCLGALAIILILSYIPYLIMWAIYGQAAFVNLGSQGPVFLLLYAITTSIYMIAMSIGIALIYARLREIKEGTSVAQLAEVFA